MQIKRSDTTANRFWRWTGIGEKTLIELLQIVATIVASVAIPLVGAMITHQQEQINDTRRQQEQDIATDNQHHQILSSYLDQMTALLLDEKRDGVKLSSEEKFIARARTLNTLPQLDGERKGRLLKFLYEARLIGGQCQIDNKTLQLSQCQNSILNLSDARLDETFFERPIPLQGIDLTEASLAKAELPRVDLTKAKMQNVNLRGAILSEATLTEAQMQEAKMTGVNLAGAILPKAKLTAAVLNNANLPGADLKQAQLERTDVKQANLSNASLTDANLQGANLEQANLSGTDLQRADLRDADLSKTSWQGANFKEALYDNSTKFPEGFDPISEGMRHQ